MNYLAHAYLSFGDEPILVGNMISDFVKGKKKLDYPAGVQIGIMLHRSIDSFTDEHAATREAKQFFKSAVGLYSGAFTDVVYDHFLALDNASWQAISLEAFSQHVYEMLNKHQGLLPERFLRMLSYMRSQNWLYNYQFKWGIERSFEGVTRRALYLNNSRPAYEAFEKNYESLQTLSEEFLHDVKKFASAEYHRVQNS